MIKYVWLLINKCNLISAKQDLGKYYLWKIVKKSLFLNIFRNFSFLNQTTYVCARKLVGAAIFLKSSSLKSRFHCITKLILFDFSKARLGQILPMDLKMKRRPLLKMLTAVPRTNFLSNLLLAKRNSNGERKKIL